MGHLNSVGLSEKTKLRDLNQKKYFPFQLKNVVPSILNNLKKPKPPKLSLCHAVIYLLLYVLAFLCSPSQLQTIWLCRYCCLNLDFITERVPNTENCKFQIVCLILILEWRSMFTK